MERCYKFSLVRFETGSSRDERLNIGLVVFHEDHLEVRVARRLDKLRAISGALSPDDVKKILSSLSDFDRRSRDSGNISWKDRFGVLSQLGPLKLSAPGDFVSDNALDYEQRIESIMTALVDPEPSVKVVRAKRSRLLTHVKRQFKSERVLAIRGEGLESHRVVTNLQIDDGLIAAMHVLETVDASAEGGLRRAISEIGVSALVLERARMKYGNKKTNTSLIYSATAEMERIAEPSLKAAEHQGAKLVNWASDSQRLGFISDISSLATPIPEARRTKPVAAMGRLI